VKTRLVVVALLVSIAGVRTARAEDPWAKGVSEDKQQAANALFAEGNELFAEQRHAPALEKYRAAIALWDHPIIHFNTAVTLIRLDRILEASDDLEKALAYGDQPFTKDLYSQALNYQKLIARQVGTVEASCSQPEGHVVLDGKPWFTCPGKQHVRVLAGEHVIVGENKGYATVSKRVVVAGGATASEAIELVRVESLVRLEYPTARWVPWTLTVVGLVVAGGGLGVYALGRSNLDDYEQALAEQCPRGCVVQGKLADERDKAEREGVIAGSMMAVGGAIAVGGFVWAIINRPKRVLPKLEISPRGGVTAQLRWRF